MLLFLQPEAVIDMKQRYVGHCNVGTDIKQASFLGQKGTFLQYGSLLSLDHPVQVTFALVFNFKC